MKTENLAPHSPGRTMALWVDKHRPKQLDQLDYHKDLAEQLKRMVMGSCDFPHMLVYGPSGAGKKTRIMAMLHELHGSSVEHLRAEQRTFKFGKSARIKLTIVSSAHHIELNPSDAGIRDCEVVQDVIKEIAQSAPVVARSAESAMAASPNFKIVLLNEAERLSKPAQDALRRTMEKHAGTCRLLLCCVNPSKVIAPIRSRCVCLRISAPSHEEICSVLEKVAMKEGLELPQTLAMRIAHSSERNLRRAVLSLEACKVANYPFTDDQRVELPDWQLYINAVADDILSTQSPQQLLKVRGRLYELLSNCIPPELIIRGLTQALIKKSPLAVKHEAVYNAAQYECSMQSGSEPIFHIEAFIARFMSVYKKHQNAA